MLRLAITINGSPNGDRVLLLIMRFLWSEPEEPRTVPTRAGDRLRNSRKAVIGFPLPAEPARND